MPGAFQGKSYPDTRASTAITPSEIAPIHRERVAFSDAELVSERVRAQLTELRLRGAHKAVLLAVLTLLCDRWTKVTDDRLRLGQVVTEILGAGGRRYHLKTVGRALAALADRELITYTAAQGRGGFAEVAIHSRFLTDITPLKRNLDGRVIVPPVTFSQPPTNTLPKGIPPYPPPIRQEKRVTGSRPTEVEVRSGELSQVLGNLPDSLTDLPHRLRWRLGGAIRAKLARGFAPTQILSILNAPEPSDLGRPWKLAMWRLQMNLPGAGPRLKPLQRAWDRQQDRHARTVHCQRLLRWYTAVTAATDPQDRDLILAAHTAKFGMAPTTPDTALAEAGRRASQMFPSSPLGQALRQWAQQVIAATKPVASPDPPPTCGPAQPTHETTERCACCDAPEGRPRDELPLKSTVCDACWPPIAAELRGETPCHADELVLA